jgi:hypothetical protein
MTDPSGYAKTLALPTGFDAPRLLRYDDVTAHAITRDDLGADVRGINASLDLIRETRGGTWPTGPVTEEEGLRRPGPARVRVPGRQVIHVLRRGRGGGYIGCAYLLPSGAQRLERTSLGPTGLDSCAPTAPGNTSPSNRSTRQQGAGCSHGGSELRLCGAGTGLVARFPCNLAGSPPRCSPPLKAPEPPRRTSNLSPEPSPSGGRACGPAIRISECRLGAAGVRRACSGWCRIREPGYRCAQMASSKRAQLRW